MDNKIKKIARAGYLAKASVYAITGILTFLAAFNLGGEKAGQNQVLEFLAKQPFGNALLILLGLGLISYAFWRFTQAISDPEELGTNKKAKLRRAAFFISGISYLGLAGLAFMQVLGLGSSGDSDTSSFLVTKTGLFLLAVFGAIFASRGIYQFIRIKKTNFSKKFQTGSMQDERQRKIIKNAAYIGMISRGIIFLIIGFFGIHAAITSNPSEMKDTAEAFSFIEDSAYGAWLLGFVAAGLIGYGIYTFMMARYRRFQD